MKIYFEDAGSPQPQDVQGAEGYVMLPDCSNCSRYRWTRGEIAAVEQAAKTACLVAINHGAADGLISPLRELWEYDNRQIGRLKGLLQIAAFSGARGVNLKQLLSAYGKIVSFIVHLEEHGKRYRAWIPEHVFMFGDLFKPVYPGKLNTDNLVLGLGITHSKTIVEIKEHLQKLLDEAEAQP